MKSMFTTQINPKIKKVAKKFGITFRIGRSPKEVKIYGVRLPNKAPCAYFGQGVIFVRKHTTLSHIDTDIALCHEIGHAVMGFFFKPKKITNKTHEVKANAIALYLAADLRLPVSQRMLRNMVAYTKTRAVRCWEK